MKDIERKARELLADAYAKRQREDYARMALAGLFDRTAEFIAIIAALTPPEGFVLVPLEPTRNMVMAACKDHGFPGGDSGTYVRGYRSMLAARPEVSP